MTRLRLNFTGLYHTDRQNFDSSFTDGEVLNLELNIKCFDSIRRIVTQLNGRYIGGEDVIELVSSQDEDSPPSFVSMNLVSPRPSCFNTSVGHVEVGLVTPVASFSLDNLFIKAFKRSSQTEVLIIDDGNGPSTEGSVSSATFSFSTSERNRDDVMVDVGS